MTGLLQRILTGLRPTSFWGTHSAPLLPIACAHIACAHTTGTTAAARQQQKISRSKKPCGRASKLKRYRGMKLTIAIEGCCHGELDKIYATLQLLEQREGKKIDLLICCGDFQAVRNLDDLETMACPPKYRAMQTFYKYYSGEKVAPFPTIFIGGNHEAANHLWELYYGGWAAPNIYFLGFAGAVRFGGLRIAGLSGIYKQHDYLRGHHESLPYNENTIRSLYHIRDFEVYRLSQLQQPVDIFLSHDWPTNIARYGNTAQLLARKAFLRSEVESGTLGSPPAAQLLAELRPAYWFSAHLHTKFAALVQHAPTPTPATPSTSTQQQQQRQAAGGGGAHNAGASGGGGSGGFPITRFLALDKCLPGRDFLQVLELDARGPPELHYDEEWLAVLRTTHHLTNLNFKHAPLPGMGALRSGVCPEDLEFVRQALAARGTSRVPDNFVVTAAPYNPGLGQRRGRMPQCHMRNPQTVALLDMLGLPYNLEHAGGGRGPAVAPPAAAATAVAVAAPGGLATPGVGGRGPAAAAAARNAPLSLAPRHQAAAGQQQQQQRPASTAAPVPLPSNPEEIDLGDLEEEEYEEQQQQQQKQQQQGQEQKEQEHEDVGQVTASDGGPAGGVYGGGAVAGSTEGQPGGGGSAVENVDEGGPAAVVTMTLTDDPMFQPLEL